MQRAGFVLAGGASRRMGRDKALLPYRGTTLLEHVARLVAQAAGSVALIGDPRYGALSYPVYPDRLPGCGPLGGIYTALSISPAAWNLVVACDMPNLSAGLLRRLLETAAGQAANCLMAAGPAGRPEPLCAVYHRRCLPVLASALRDKRFKMKELVAELGAGTLSVDPAALANVNTPGEWAPFEEQSK